MDHEKYSTAALTIPSPLVAKNDHHHRIRPVRLNRGAKGTLSVIFGGFKSKRGSRSSKPKSEKFDGKSKDASICQIPEISKIPSQINLSLIEKYGECQETIGSGAFGVVRLAHKVGSGGKEQLFAVKEFRQQPGKNELSDEDLKKLATTEHELSSSLRHSNIIKTYDLMDDESGALCAVMEFCAGGDLHKYILHAGKLEVVEADCFFKQLMSGVDYLHENGVAHRDLKPENLVLTTNGSLKIADFGNMERLRFVGLELQLVDGVCGSGPYIAPEQYIDTVFDAKAVDIWASGVIYMTMRNCQYLWIEANDADEDYQQYIADRKTEKGYRPIEELRKETCVTVIYSLLDPHRTRRLTASQFLRTQWAGEIQICEAGLRGT